MKDKFRVMTVFGTRPEAVKMAPLVREIQKRDAIHLVNVVTGQHREMLDQILRAFNIVPDLDLDIMRPGQTLNRMAARAMEGLDQAINDNEPQLILAQGDTLTTFAASLAAFYARIDFGHVEAGLRSDNRFEPYPEEMNRRMTTLCASMHFAPTELARQRLLAEGVPASDIWMTGNTVIDALNQIVGLGEPMQDTALDAWIGKRRLVLVTAHRRENWGQPMESICRAVRRLLERFSDAVVVFPMHRNPIVRETVIRELGSNPSAKLIEPPDYLEFVKLMQRAWLILTDSGGVQEEAPSLGKPVLVLRNTTERPEGVEAGNSKLVGTDEEMLLLEASVLMENPYRYQQMSCASNPYGDGQASVRICRAIEERYSLA